MSKGDFLAGADLSGLPGEGLAVVGYSGGADSTALAHWLMGRIEPRRLVLAHVNHMLRGEEGDRDEAAAREFAGRHGLRFALLKADVGKLARERGMGLEECGRAVRYEFFRSLASGEQDRILTAHNADDNVETILLNLCRGASLQGLCGIPPQRGKILRPFLAVSRAEIEAYCGANGLSFVTDSTNFSEDFARNRVRAQIVPALKELNPRLIHSLCQTASLLREDQALLLEQARALLEQARAPFGLSARVLKSAPGPLCSRALKLYLEEEGCGRLEKKHLDAAAGILRRGGSFTLPGGASLRCAQEVLSLGWGEKPEGFCVPVGLGETPIPGGRRLFLEKKSFSGGEMGLKIHNLYFKNLLDYDIITGNLVARSRRPGDRFAPAGRNVTKTLKQLFQENRVPAKARGSAVLLECGGELAFCEGVGPARRFCVTEKTKTVLTVEIREC